MRAYWAGSATYIYQAGEAERMRRNMIQSIDSNWINKKRRLKITCARTNQCQHRKPQKHKIYSILAESTICLDHWIRVAWTVLLNMRRAFRFRNRFHLFFTWEPNSTYTSHSLIRLVWNCLFARRQNLLSCNKLWQRLLKLNSEYGWNG